MMTDPIWIKVRCRHLAGSLSEPDSRGWEERGRLEVSNDSVEFVGARHRVAITNIRLVTQTRRFFGLLAGTEEVRIDFGEAETIALLGGWFGPHDCRPIYLALWPHWGTER